MKKQIITRLPEPLKVTSWALNILFLIILGGCQKETPSQTNEDSSDDQEITFQKTYGGVADESVGAVMPTNDSGYVLVSGTESYSSGNYDEDIYLLKVDQRGNTQWTKAYGTPWLEEDGYSVKQTTDGGYIIGGYGLVCDGRNETLVLVKTDASGNIQWNKGYGDFWLGYNYDVIQTNDGYIAVGTAAHKQGIHCIKTNENGEIVWSKEYWGLEGGLIVNTNDGGYAIAGVSPPEDIRGFENILLIKTDSRGDVLWSKTYGELGGSGRPTSLKQTIDGGFIIAGRFPALVIKTDAGGNLTWSKKYSGTIQATDIEQTTDEGYILSCATGNYANGIYAGLIKTDTNGEVIWSKKYGGGKEDVCSVHQVKDGGYVIGGQTSAFTDGNIDLYLVKTDSSGNSGCNETAVTVTASTLAPQVKSVVVAVSTGAYSCSPGFVVGTGGIETTLCSK